MDANKQTLLGKSDQVYPEGSGMAEGQEHANFTELGAAEPVNDADVFDSILTDPYYDDVTSLDADFVQAAIDVTIVDPSIACIDMSEIAAMGPEPVGDAVPEEREIIIYYWSCIQCGLRSNYPLCVEHRKGSPYCTVDSDIPSYDNYGEDGRVQTIY